MLLPCLILMVIVLMFVMILMFLMLVMSRGEEEEQQVPLVQGFLEVALGDEF